MRKLTIEEAKQLKINDVVWFEIDQHAEHLKRWQKWRINGKVQLWKRDPNKIKIPIKFGLYEFSYITQNNIDKFLIDK